MREIVRRTMGLMTAGIAGVMALGTAAGAQQLVDAGGEDGEGGLAFVLMTLLILGIGLALFYMDRVRKRALERDETEQS